MWGNCWAYTHRRRQHVGGYIVLRESVHGYWSHRFHTVDFETFTTFETTVDWLSALYRRVPLPLPPLWFPGEVRTYTREQVMR